MANRVSLPPSLLAAVEAHRCFSGCYSDGSTGIFCTDVGQPALPMVEVHCSDCLTWHVGVPAHLLPSSIQGPTALAHELSRHMRRHRGFMWSLSGYHLAGHLLGGGFWLTAVCLGPGVFVVRPNRGRGPVSDAIHVLLEAFHLKLAPCSGPRMLDAKDYVGQPIHIRYSPGDPVTPDKASLLGSPQCRTTWAPGFEPAVVVEHLPSVAAAATTVSHSPVTAASPSSSSTTSGSRALHAAVPGEVCSTCGHEVMVRQLLYGTYSGCLC